MTKSQKAGKKDHELEFLTKVKRSENGLEEFRCFRIFLLRLESKSFKCRTIVLKKVPLLQQKGKVEIERNRKKQKFTEAGTSLDVQALRNTFLVLGGQRILFIFYYFFMKNLQY